ncbi:MAG: hypothetical protein RBT30_01390 [Patescibacteria group bacterium]|jgi:hypothetical protein|nr:hypothetical protein [Patescibacteria group bacterium]
MKTEELDSLNISVIKALNLLKDYKLPKINLKKYNFPIVIGSGNAYNAGQIIFSRQKAIFANESNALAILQLYKKLIKNKVISEAVIISASGEKDSIWEIKAAKKMGLKTILFSCSPNSSAAKLADECLFFPKLSEPYTYNVSTYLSMISAAFPENIDTLISFILKLKIPQKFKQYQAYSFILPDQFNAIAPMLDIKKSELFGPHLSLRAFSFGEARHAKFVIRDQNELVISFGKNKYFGATKSRWEININKNFGPGAIMALSYFLIGLIQEAKPDYFRENITPFCRDYGYKAYPKSKAFPVIVPGNIE